MAEAPGRSERNGVTIKQSMERPVNGSRVGFGQLVANVPRYGNSKTAECGARHPMLYRCYSCHRHVSVRIGTVLERSHVSLQNWAIAIYMHLTSLNGVSSMKLHRDIGVTQKTAWFMLQCMRKAFENDDNWPFGGPFEVDESHVEPLRQPGLQGCRRPEGGLPHGVAVVDRPARRHHENDPAQLGRFAIVPTPMPHYNGSYDLRLVSSS